MTGEKKATKKKKKSKTDLLSGITYFCQFKLYHRSQNINNFGSFLFDTTAPHSNDLLVISCDTLFLHLFNTTKIFL